MNRLNELKSHLKKGNTYRRADLVQWTKSVDRHLEELLSEGTLQKVSAGVYHYPKASVFGNVPPDENDLVSTFLKDNRFLLVTPNLYNSLGLGTTQLYNKKVVYNHKRHGKFKLANREFDFQLKHHFPSKITEEFLLVDMINNIKNLAEDHNIILENLVRKASQMSLHKLKRAVTDYGTIKTKKIFDSMIFTTTQHG